MRHSRFALAACLSMLGMAAAHADGTEEIGNWNVLTRFDRITDAVRYTVIIGSAPDGGLSGSKLVFRFACEEGRPQTLKVGAYNPDGDFPDQLSEAVVDARVDKQKPLRQRWRIADRFAIQQSARLSRDFLTYLKAGSGLFIRYHSHDYFVEVDFKLDRYAEVLAKVSSACKLGIG